MWNLGTQSTELFPCQVDVEKEESQLISDHSHCCLIAPLHKDSCPKSMFHYYASVKELRQSYPRLLESIGSLGLELGVNTEFS